MPEFLFVLTLSALPVVSNFIGATIAEALPLSKQTLGLALHAAAGVLLAIASTELIPRVLIAKPAWMTILALFLGGAFFVWINQLLDLDKNRLRGQGDLLKLIVLAFTTGTLIVAIVEEILPEAHQTQDTNLSTLTFIGSFALSMLFSSYLE